jgi:hypothetical protein
VIAIEKQIFKIVFTLIWKSWQPIPNGRMSFFSDAQVWIDFGVGRCSDKVFVYRGVNKEWYQPLGK